MLPSLLFVFLALDVVKSQHFAKASTACPSKEDIKPCVCQDGTQAKPWVTCSGLSSPKKLLKATQGMQGYAFSIVYLENSNMGLLPSDIFEGVEIQSLNIAFTNLTALNEGVNRPPFLGLEKSLEYLEIRECFLNEQFPLSRLSLSHLKKLNTIEFNSNLLPLIGNDWFESGPYGLRELYLHDSSTNQLGSHAFASLVNLKKFSLTGGTIRTVTRDMFPKSATSLEVLDLSDNQLTSLPHDIFFQMPSLSEVYLDNNGITEINELIWAPVWNQLTHVYFFGNSIKCDENIKWLYKYRLPEVLGGKCGQPAAMKDLDLSKLTIADFQ